MVKTKMQDLVNDFENLKISAFSKYKKVRPYIKNVTLGPNRILPEKQSFCNEPAFSQPSSNTPHFYDGPNDLHLIKLGNGIELDRRETVQNAINRRLHSFAEHDNKQKVINKKEWQQRKQCLLEQIEQEEIGIIKALERNEQEEAEKRQALITQYRLLEERRKENEEKIRLNELKKRQRIEMINKIRKNQIEFREVYQEIATIIRNCTAPVEIKSVLADIRPLLQSLPDYMNGITERCQSGKISEKDVLGAETCMVQIKKFRDIISKRIEMIDTKRKNDDLYKTEGTVQQTIKPVHKPTADTTASTTSNNTTVQNISGDIAIQKFMSKSSIKCYAELQTFINNYSCVFQELLKNDSLKQFRNDCKKAVNIPVNATSAVNSQHLLDKYNRLYNLLQGNKVYVGKTEVVASKHPQGIPFCMDLLAKKFVLQGDLMIFTNPDAAFGYATIILSLWNQFPEFGRLFLQHIYWECVYLIPFYPPRLVDQTDEEYYKSQGYHYSEGVVEKQDKFLKRMTGIMRLYAAIIISKPKSDQKTSPYGITHGWKWLSAFLNLEPRIDITATMIHAFLEMAGSTMQIVYGKQFHKLMDYLCNIYMPVLKKYDSGGPFTRLEVLLQNYQKTRQFEKPKGILPLNFW